MIRLDLNRVDSDIPEAMAGLFGHELVHTALTFTINGLQMAQIRHHFRPENFSTASSRQKLTATLHIRTPWHKHKNKSKNNSLHDGDTIVIDMSSVGKIHDESYFRTKVNGYLFTEQNAVVCVRI